MVSINKFDFVGGWNASGNLSVILDFFCQTFNKLLEGFVIFLKVSFHLSVMVFKAIRTEVIKRTKS